MICPGNRKNSCVFVPLESSFFPFPFLNELSKVRNISSVARGPNEMRQKARERYGEVRQKKDLFAEKEITKFDEKVIKVKRTGST